MFTYASVLLQHYSLRSKHVTSVFINLESTPKRSKNKAITVKKNSLEDDNLQVSRAYPAGYYKQYPKWEPTIP